MTCKELIDFISAYLDGELSAETRLIFDQHLAVCNDCAAYLESYKQTIDLLKDDRLKADSTIPEDVPQSLIDAILDSQPK